jgi:hypothetical protein
MSEAVTKPLASHLLPRTCPLLQVGVQHFVFSSLEDPRPVVKGTLPELHPGRIVPHFEAKAEIVVRCLCCRPLLNISLLYGPYTWQHSSLGAALGCFDIVERPPWLAASLNLFVSVHGHGRSL